MLFSLSLNYLLYFCFVFFGHFLKGIGRKYFFLPTQDNKLHLMTFRTVNIRRALQSALQRPRADESDTVVDVLLEEANYWPI